MTLGSRYPSTDRIATGGMGEVWRATDAVLGREVAVKLLKRPSTPTTRRSAAGSRPRRGTAPALHHPNIATVFDFGELPTDGDARPYL